MGTPCPSTNWLRLTPFLARSVGFLPVFFPPEGCLGHAPVHTQPLPVDPLDAVVVEQTGLPPLGKDARLDPFLKAVVSGGSGTELGGVQGFPLAAGAEDEEDGIGTDAVGGARPTATERMGIDVGGDGDFQDFPEVIGNAPIVGDNSGIHDQSSCSILKQL
jgi:hypothetical protein